MVVNNLLKYVVPLALISTPINSALAEDLAYFAGMDIGVHAGGSVTESSTGTHKENFKKDPVLGIHGGIVVNNHHRLTIGADYKAVVGNHDVMSKAKDIATGYIHYDYLVPVSDNVIWSIGPGIGYEKFMDNDVSDLDGMVYGAQTGLEYRVENWGIGAEAIYLIHDAKADGFNDDGNFKTSLDDETQFKLSAKYYF